MPSHIIPASAPNGVRYAPKFEPITHAYTAPVPAPFCRIEPNKTLIGILLKRLQQSVEHKPYKKTSSLLKSFASFSVTPLYSSDATKTNIDTKNGISG